jgi:hypothetical protein
VPPAWCFGKDESWAALVDLWVSEDEEWVAKSKKTGLTEGPMEHMVRETGTTPATRQFRYIYVHETFFFFYSPSLSYVSLTSVWWCRRKN